ncbi:MAG: 3-oxoacyl-ACP synthase [Lentisphaerae bacterium GWF2_44_16]|nr:MAG: 3-oxoacyl-ACP synthase [Lentisphaerae bacterium GWF2_44_16]
MGIRIVGIGSYTPERVLTNKDLEKMVDTSDEWISTRTGIKERRIAADNEFTSDLAVKAAQRAMEMAGVSPEEIDVITVASITNDRVFPSTACFVQKKIGAANAVCFDVQAACSGLLYSLEVANNMLKGSSKYKTFLVIGAEKLSTIVDWQDRNTCVLFGDGASALLLKKTDDDKECILSTNLGSDGNYTDILHLPAGGSAMPASHETIDQRLHYLKMGGREVFKLAVNAMVSSCHKALAEANVKASDLAWLVPHQANLRILQAVAERLEMPVDNVYVNVNKYGNTSAASIGIALDEMLRGGKIHKGDLILLTAFGGGLTWASTLLRWC